MELSSSIGPPLLEECEAVRNTWTMCMTVDNLNFRSISRSQASQDEATNSGEKEGNVTGIGKHLDNQLEYSYNFSTPLKVHYGFSISHVLSQCSLAPLIPSTLSIPRCPSVHSPSGSKFPKISHISSQFPHYPNNCHLQPHSENSST